MKTYYIGEDVHKQSTTIAVRQNKKIINMTTIPTQIDKLIEFLDQFQGRKYLAIEESSLAAWLNSHLHDKVDKLIFCDPRRNRLICDDGDKDDPIDAVKWTELLANNSLRQIHHTANQRHLALKQWTTLYHDRMREKVRQQLKLQACALQHGIHLPSCVTNNSDRRKTWLNEISDRSLTVLMPHTHQIHRCEMVFSCQRAFQAYAWLLLSCLKGRHTGCPQRKFFEEKNIFNLTLFSL